MRIADGLRHALFDSGVQRFCMTCDRVRWFWHRPHCGRYSPDVARLQEILDGIDLPPAKPRITRERPSADG